METRARSIIKAITWRIIASAVAFAVAYVLTGSPGESIELTVIVSALNIITYYAHERFWNKVTWGRQ